MKYGILFGGRSYEHDISIITAVEAAARLNGEVYPIYAKNGDFYLVKGKFDVASFARKTLKMRRVRLDSQEGKGCILCGCKKIFLDCMIMCCHGGEGEDGRFSALMEVFDFPYTASSPLVSAVTMDKAASKIFFEHYGFPTAKAIVAGWGDDVLAVAATLRYPLIVKPVRLGSSIGINIAHDEEELIKSLAVAYEYDKEVLVEEVVEHAVELNCAAFSENGEVVVSAVESPMSWHDFLTFEDKYKGGKYKFGSKTEVEPALAERVRTATAEIYQKMGLFGIARVDYLYSPKEDVLYVNEINSQPGSLAYYLFERVDIPFGALLERVARAAVARADGKGIIQFDSGVLDNLCDLRAK